MNVPDFATALYMYCQATRATVTRWTTSPERNAREGGSPRSAHLVGLAARLEYDTPYHGPDREQLAASFGLELHPIGDTDQIQPRNWDTL